MVYLVRLFNPKHNYVNFTVIGQVETIEKRRSEGWVVTIIKTYSWFERPDAHYEARQLNLACRWFG